MKKHPAKIPIFSICCIVAAILTFSCISNSRKGDTVVAKVGDKLLYFSEMSHVFPKGCSKDDSMALAKLYIDNWVKTRLLLKKAELNLSKEQLNINEELETYRTSLLIYKYEEQMLREKMDTVVLDYEIKSYYEANKVNFTCEEHAVRAVFIVLPTNAPTLWNVRRWCLSDKEKDIQDLTDYCRRYAVSFDFFADEWVRWSNIDFPQKEVATRQLAYSDRIEQQDEDFIYLVGIKEKRNPGDTAPLAFVKERIKSIIINKRKLKFISELEQNIFNDALAKKQFEIYQIHE